MKKHKVIAVIKNAIKESEFRADIEEIATYERTYNSKSAALRNMREFCKRPIMPSQGNANGGSSAKFHIVACVEDIETGRKFNFFENGCVDHAHKMSFEEAKSAKCDKLVEALEAEGFVKVS